jgi:curved DNA-binding protein CbpA
VTAKGSYRATDLTQIKPGHNILESDVKDLYGILGVDPHASTTEIQKAFRSKARKLHPDVGGDEDAFKELEEAHRILSDIEERMFYDRVGEIRPPQVDTAHAEMMAMLAEMVSGVIKEMRNPATEDFIGHIRKMIDAGTKNISALSVAAGEHRIKLESVKRRIRSRSPENVLGAIVQHKIDEIDRELARAKIMLQAFRDGTKFLDNYTYDVTLLLMNSDLAEALRRQDSGKYDNFFRINPI